MTLRSPNPSQLATPRHPCLVIRATVASMDLTRRKSENRSCGIQGRRASIHRFATLHWLLIVISEVKSIIIISSIVIIVFIDQFSKPFWSDSGRAGKPLYAILKQPKHKEVNRPLGLYARTHGLSGRSNRFNRPLLLTR